MTHLYARRPHFIDDPGQPPPACREHDPSLWFPKQGEGWKTREAKAICATCPHQHACRRWALAQPVDQLHGVWGGTTQNERRRERKAHP